MNKTLRMLLIVLLAGLMLFSLGRIAMIQWDYWKAEKLYEELRAQSVRIEERPVVQETEEVEEETLPVVHINLEGLQAENPEVLGWLWIPETQINYPLLQGRDNQKYLTKNYRLKYDVGGSIFMDFRNGADFSDDNTVLYGHNMKNGAMFGGLKQYGDPEYRDNHPYIYVFTKEETLQYRIFAAYKTESTSRSYTRDFSEDGGGFLTYVQASAKGNLTELPAGTDRILTLSTCTSVRKTERFVIHGALVDRETAVTPQG